MSRCLGSKGHGTEQVCFQLPDSVWSWICLRRRTADNVRGIWTVIRSLREDVGFWKTDRVIGEDTATQTCAYRNAELGGVGA